MRSVRRAWAGVLPHRSSERGRERAPDLSNPGGAVAIRALILGGARSGKSAFAEQLVSSLGGERVLYVATAFVGDDEDLRRRVKLHKDRRPCGWGTLEVGNLREVPKSVEQWDAVLLDSLTLWVSARGEERAITEFEDFLTGVGALTVPFVLVSDEVGLGVVPESEVGRRFRDTLGLVNQRAAAAADEVHLCVAGVGVRIK